MDKPKRIYLQIEDSEPTDYSYVTWDMNMINDTDVEYVLLESLTPCTNIDCDKGFALIPGTAQVTKCPVCNGTGSVINKE